MKRLSERQKLYILTFLMIGGSVFVFYKYAFDPLTKEIKRLSDEKKQKTEKLLHDKKEAARLPFVEAEGRRLKIELSYAEEVLPKELDISFLITTLTQLGEENNVYFSSFSPGGIEEKGDYAVYPISLPLVGSFHNVLRFLCSIGNLPRLINVVDLSISAAMAQAEEGGSIDTVSIPLRLEAYIYR